MSEPKGAKVTVVGVGPGDGRYLSSSVESLILKYGKSRKAFIRTKEHPTFDHFSSLELQSFDYFYEKSDSRYEVYESIANKLIELAHEHGEILYVVPGSPLVGEYSVTLLTKCETLEVEVIPAVSFLDLAWSKLGVDPMATGVLLVDGEDFRQVVGSYCGPIVVGQCWSKMILSEIKLSVEDPLDSKVVVLKHLGLEDESIFQVEWDDLDRSFEPDHLTSIYIEKMPKGLGSEFIRLEEITRTLREKCPWDKEQSHLSLVKHFVEEVYEAVEAVYDMDLETDGSHLEEELGDVLFQVFFHSRLAAEEGLFTISDVCQRLSDKLVARHPHVFGDVKVSSADEVLANWEKNKVAEKGRLSVMDGIPKSLPALAYFSKIWKKGESLGVDMDGEFEQIIGELPDLEGLLRLIVQLVTAKKIDLESEVRNAANRLRSRVIAQEDIKGQQI